MPRYLVLAWSDQAALNGSPRAAGEEAASWMRWVAPHAREGVVSAAGALAERVCIVTRTGSVPTVSDCDARAVGAPWAFLVVETESLAAAIALAASGPSSVACRVEVRALLPRSESPAAIGDLPGTCP